MAEPLSRLTLLEALGFRRDIGKRLGGEEDITLRFPIVDTRKFAELGASLRVGKVIEVVFQIVAYQPPAIIVRGEDSAMYLTDAQLSQHLPLLSQAFELALES